MPNQDTEPALPTSTNEAQTNGSEPQTDVIGPMREAYLSTSDLLVDPNNYRFQDTDNFVYAAPDRFHEENVQKRALLRLRQDEGLQALKNSILRNGFIPVERIVVRPYTPLAGKYVVIEGNRRLASMRWILDDDEAGVTIDESLLESG